MIRIFLPLVIVTFVIVAVGIAPAVAQSSEEVSAQILVEGTKEGTKPRVKLGESFTLILTVKRPAGTKVFVPSSPDVSPFKLRNYSPPTAAAGKDAEEHRYTLMAVRLGARRIPRIELTYRLANGKTGAIQTPRIKVFVASHLQNDQERQLAPPPAPVPVKATHWGLLWLLSVIGTALIAAVLTLIVLRILRDRLIAGATKEPVLPPNELALTKLQALETSEQSAGQRYAETIDVLREYLGGRFRFDGLESTTAELKVHLEACDLDEEAHELTTQIVEEADLIKFAKMTPGEDETRAVIAQVKNVVLTTWVEPDPEEDNEGPRLEEADRLDRLKGGLLDALLFGVPCLVLFVVLWLQDQLHLGWLPIASFCVLMLGRDLFGHGSFGKKLLGLRIATRDQYQTSPSLKARLGRNLMCFFAPVGLPIEALILAYNPITERLGDRWFKTDVVHREGYARRQGGSS